jgi:hypothetical protein
MTRARGTALWLAGNLGGVAVYLLLASRLWPPAELRGTPDAIGPGDPFIWASTVVPTFIVCATFNIAIIAWSGWRRRRSAEWQPTRWAWVIPVLWATACTIDRVHF